MRPGADAGVECGEGEAGESTRERAEGSKKPVGLRRDQSRPLPRPKPANLRFGFLVRILVLAGVAIMGSLWGLVRFYTHVKQPILVPVPHVPPISEPVDGDGGARLIPAPEIEIEAR
jgi:hypothetical protein